MRLLNQEERYAYRLIRNWSIILLAIFLIISIIQNWNTYRITESVIVEIERGYVIWDIASEYAPEDRDITLVISDIKNLNNLDNASQVYPGQRVRVPVYEKHNWLYWLTVDIRDWLTSIIDNAEEDSSSGVIIYERGGAVTYID